ncbi:MAG: AAA family ATPase [Pseudomonadota bacterium]
MSKEKVPNPGELEKELNDYLSNKYGDRVRLSVPFLFPDRAVFKTDDEAPEEKKKKDQAAPAFNFTLKPRDLEAYLNEYVVKQDRAKEILATKICTHFNRVKNQDKSPSLGNIKNNILMIGPTGVGKTFLIKLIAQKIGVPFVKGDATKFSETGYVGGDVEDLVRDLVREADGDIVRAQYGIIYIDEIDKIAGSRNAWGLDVSRTGVQRALLKPMEETEVDLKVPHDMLSQMEALENFRKTGKREKRIVNTRNILFIVSGAFGEIDEIIEKRLNRQGMGFGAELRTKEKGEASFLQMVKAEDLVHYGFESEFIGRLPVIASFEPLTVEDLYLILKNPNSAVIISKKKDFMAYGIDIRFEDAALRRIAEMAFEEKTGARGLISAVEKILLKYEKALPSLDIRRLVVTEEMALKPREEFEKLLGQQDLRPMYEQHRRLVAAEEAALKERIRANSASLDEACRFFLADRYLDTIVRITVERCFDYRTVIEDAVLVLGEAYEFEKAFTLYHGVEIHFDESGLNKIIERVLMEDLDAMSFLRALFINYNHGLKLIQERSGKASFELTEQAIDEPQEYLNKLIKQSYIPKE